TKGQKVAGFCTLLRVPLKREGETIGGIVLVRTKGRQFTDKQNELAKKFAAQAVIAIEKTQLLNKFRESFQSQTATSEVLGVISSAPGELQSVFETILANATRICGAKFGVLYLAEDDCFRRTAHYNTPPAYLELLAREPVYRPGPGTAFARIAATR